MSTELTIAVCARNAEETIGRTLASVMKEDVDVLVVDDFSTDGTVAAAKNIAQKRVKIVCPTKKRGLGNARQVAMEQVQTPFLMWVDADDEVLPGRVDRFREALRSGADVVFDAAELVDGESGQKIRDLTIPGFMQRPGVEVRLFERNYLPGLAWGGLRRDFALKVGYDVNLLSGDDLDFALRAIRAKGKFQILPEIGYRQFSYSNSLSRDMNQQLSCVAIVLKKFSNAEIRKRYLDSNLPEKLAMWATIFADVFRRRPDGALNTLNQLYSSEPPLPTVLERGGAFPEPEGWYFHFMKGSLSLQLSDFPAAVAHLSRSLDFRKAPEALNNLGVVRRSMGDNEKAQTLFKRALDFFPDFGDAKSNLSNSESLAVTKLPLRHYPSRHEYS